MSLRMRKPTICICENKGADQLRYTDGTIPLLKSEILSFKPASVTAQAGLCQTWSETKIVGFVMHRLIY